MEVVIGYATWFVISLWASYVVSRRLQDRRHRFAYYLLIWLVPVIGAAAAVMLSHKRERSKSPDEKMFDEVINAHKDSD